VRALPALLNQPLTCERRKQKNTAQKESLRALNIFTAILVRYEFPTEDEEQREGDVIGFRSSEVEL
jgi:hypothetical protein